MEKILEIDNKKIKFKSTGAFLLRYKMQFQRDAMQDIINLSSSIGKDKNKISNINSIDLEVLYNLVWSLAKAADDTIPPPIEWLDTFEEFPIIDIINDLIDMIFICMKSTKDIKKKMT